MALLRGQRRYIGEGYQLELATGVGNESVTLTWLEDALEHAYAHGQMKTLAYLEAVIEDMVFMMEMADTRKPSTDG